MATVPPLNMPQSSEEPQPKKPKQERFLNVAVAGCSHGEMDRIYSTLASLEYSQRIKFDLLICCGDYQSVRNFADLHTMHVNPKFRQLGTFHQYYSGEKVAPIFTIFIGGNHEASSYLAELPNGGWVAPNIFYMGYSNVVKFAGLSIGGLSGIFKPQDYHRGHFERPPYKEHGSVISAYHVRSLDVFRLKQLVQPQSNSLDIMVTHDWPVEITNYGNTAGLLRYKPYFKEDIERNALGNPETMDLLKQLKPRYWFSAHLHCRYEAQVQHEDVEETKFLALGKPAARQKFVEYVQIPIDDDVEFKFEYDSRWCSVLRSTDHLCQYTPGKVYMPSSTGNEAWDFRPTPADIQTVTQLFNNDFTIPNNFQQTAPPHKLTDSPHEPCLYYLNPQSTEFCEKLQITNFNKVMYEKVKECQGIPFSQHQNVTGGAEEIDLGNVDDEDEFGDDFFVLDGDDDEEPQCCDHETNAMEEPITTATTIVQEEKVEEYVPPSLGKTTVADRLLKRRHVDIPEEE